MLGISIGMKIRGDLRYLLPVAIPAGQHGGEQ
jgi:hypothetical protein